MTYYECSICGAHLMTLFSLSEHNRWLHQHEERATRVEVPFTGPSREEIVTDLADLLADLSPRNSTG